MKDTVDEIPTLAEWAGGPERLKALFDAFYARVPGDAVLAPVFAGMDPHHAEHVAAFVGEVFGGPRTYSEAGGGHAQMIARHIGRRLTEAQRRRWVGLMLETADDVGLPSDPEFRAAFVGYLEWGTRLAVINSPKASSRRTTIRRCRYGDGDRPAAHGAVRPRVAAQLAAPRPFP